MQKHHILDAIAAFCKKSKKRYSDEYIDMHNELLYRKMTEPKPRGTKQSIAPKPPKECYIYVIKDTVRGFHKIGKATNLANRFSSLRTANPAIEIVCHFKGNDFDEKQLHAIFNEMGKHIDGEWFSLTQDDINTINDYFTSKAA